MSRSAIGSMGSGYDWKSAGENTEYVMSMMGLPRMKVFEHEDFMVT